MAYRYYQFVLTFFVVFPMTFIMSIVGALRSFGWRDGFVGVWLNNWSVMLPVAYAAAFIIIPNARKLTDWLHQKSPNN